MSGRTEPPPQLPAPISVIVPPETFSPSSFVALERCPLSVLHGLDEDEMLPPSPLALLGDAIHRTMQSVQGGPLATSSEEAVLLGMQELELNLGLVEKKLNIPYTAKYYSSLRSLVDEDPWHSRIDRLKSWMIVTGRKPEVDRQRAKSSDSMERGEESKTRSSAARSPTTTIPIGSEREVYVPGLGLSGRIDLIEREPDGIVHITDFKTGNLKDDTGELIDEYALQVRSYALALEEIDPTVELRLWLMGDERVQVPWNNEHRERIVERLAALREALPGGSPLTPESLAHTGQHCRSCRARHRCPEYQRRAPKWWIAGSERPPSPPLDTWGTVLSVRECERDDFRVTLKDAADRMVRIFGLTTRTGIQNVEEGSRLALFSLERRENLLQHGSISYPSNFHIDSPNRYWKDATLARVFQGPA